MHARRHLPLILPAAILLTALAGLPPAPAYAAREKVGYDFALSECFGAMLLTDPEMQGKMYDGEGFAWSPQRDAIAQKCMSGYGYSMPGTYDSRVGGPATVGPSSNPETIRNNFRSQMIQYGGEAALAQIDAGRDMTFIPQAKTMPLIQAAKHIKGGSRPAGAAPSGARPAAYGTMPVPSVSPPSIAAPSVLQPGTPAAPSAAAPSIPSPPSAQPPARPAPPTPTGGANPIFLPH
jgi:hypothetical protein